jgi:hypothetical protein
VLVALTAVAVYAPILHQGFVWDDHRLIESNAGLGAPDAWVSAFTTDYWHGADLPGSHGGDHRLYRPLLKLLLITEYRLFGVLSAGSWHAVSLVLHAICGALVFRWLRRRFGDATGGLWAAFAGALVFVLHPSRAESVAWVSAASDLWTTLILLLALEAWDASESAGATTFATLGFVAALLCKEASIAVPVVLAADAFWLTPTAAERRAKWRRLAVPITALVLVFIVRLGVVPLRDDGALHNVGSRPARFFASVGRFFEMALWPIHPSTQIGYLRSSAFDEKPIYPTSVVTLGVAVVVVLLVAAAIALRRPGWRPVMADLGWFWILALPAMNLIPLAGIQYTGERFLYLPGLGLAALATRTGLALAARPLVARAAAAAFATVLVGFGAITRAHTLDFADELTLWTSEHRRDPTNGFVLESLYTAAMKAGQYQQASDAALESLALQAAPKAKAYELLQWTRAQVELRRNDSVAMGELRTQIDGLADGRVGGAFVASQVPAEGLAWLRSTPAFVLTRTWLALRTGDFETAIQLSNSARGDPLAVRAALLARAAEGRWNDAVNIASDPLAPPSALEIVTEASHRPDADSLAARGDAVLRLGDPSLARTVVVSSLDTAPQSDGLLRLAVGIDVSLQLWDEARQLIVKHRTAANDAWSSRMIGLIEQAHALSPH